MSLYAFANDLLREGVSFVPILPDGSKKPPFLWAEYQRRFPTPDEATRWYGNGTRFGIAAICGDISRNLEDLDIDAPELEEPFRDLVMQHEGGADLLARLVIIRTPSGGAAYGYRCESPIPGSTKLARRPGNKAKGESEIEVLFETRGNGGYFLLPGCPASCHPLQKTYQLIQGDFSKIPVITKDERELLHSCARAFDAMPARKEYEARSSSGDSAGNRPGDEFNQRASWREVLKDWTLVFSRNDISYWRRPGKNFGVSATTNHGGTNRLKVFSTSTPFDTEGTYDLFSAKAVLEYNGDYSECAKALAAAGYGTPTYEPKASQSEHHQLSLEDFYAYMPMHSYIFVPGREMWPAASVNSKVSAPEPEDKSAKEDKFAKASAWLDACRSVEQMTWAPGEQMIIQDRLISEGGWIPHAGVKCFNLYRPAHILLGDPAQATEWLAHVNKVYPQDMEHIIRWLAHRVQRPQEKINHALVLGGLQGIGKDTLLEPVKYAVGPWNFSEVSPTHLLGRFNGFIKSVILRINEARDLGDIDRFSFYDHLKAYTAAPPDVLRCDEKHLREYSVFNVCGVVITTNHKTDGIYLPADDRRHYVAWSDLSKDDFKADYWTNLYRWYESEGYRHVAAYLHSIDLSSFDPKAPPPKTDAFWSIVDANQAPEDAELSDAIDKLGNPEVLTLADICAHVDSDFAQWLRNRGNARIIPHRMEEVGYVAVRNPGVKDTKWKINGKRQVVYAQRSLCIRDQIAAASLLLRGAR
ncbi:MAG: bifunctional DNA primase/polymerase [Acidobacteria bacterium]|nr:bifunctional DNA primase/polymerase [Acidobacteriota bacterium]